MSYWRHLWKNMLSLIKSISRCLSGTKRTHQLNRTGKHTAICPQCGKHFTRVGDLKKHHRIHEGGKPFPCSRCDKSFSQSSNLNVHQMTHTGEKSFVCFLCGKSFSLAHPLRTHQLTHTREKTFKCSQCDMAFTRYYTLQRHKSTHSGEMAISCTWCDKAFSRSSEMKHHQRIHTGEKPFPCSLCGKTFSYSRAMKTHMLTRIEGNSFSCSQYGKTLYDIDHEEKGKVPDKTEAADTSGNYGSLDAEPQETRSVVKDDQKNIEDLNHGDDLEEVKMERESLDEIEEVDPYQDIRHTSLIIKLTDSNEWKCVICHYRMIKKGNLKKTL